MKQVYPVIFTQLNDKKDTVLINVPDMNILTEGFGLPDAIEMARRFYCRPCGGIHQNLYPQMKHD